MTNDELSKQYHSLRFYNGTYSYKDVFLRIGNKTQTIEYETEKYVDTWIDLHLIPLERPIVSAPPGNTKFVTIPGRKDPIDLSDYYTGHPTYQNRTGSWSFATDNDFVKANGGWEVFDARLNNLFHGKRVKVELRDDPAYFYTGTVQLAQWQTGATYSTIGLNYNLYPFKKDKISSMDLWEWDTFSFTSGVINYAKDLDVEGSRAITIIGGTERSSPRIYATSDMTVSLNNSRGLISGSVSALTWTIIPGMVIVKGENRFQVQGNGYVTIDYRRGIL